MKISIDDGKRENIEKCHDGEGSILFREVFSSDDFKSNLRHFHETVINPHSTIGYHKHHGNEEIYYLVEGTGIMQLNGKKFPVKSGDSVIAQDGESHGLINNSDEPIRILVFECKY